MRIDVTEEDIKNGRPTDPYCCPVAIAISRGLGVSHVAVGGLIEIGESEYSAPLAVREFIANFDSNTPVAPFSFDLPVSDTAVVPVAALQRAACRAVVESDR